MFNKPVFRVERGEWQKCHFCHNRGFIAITGKTVCKDCLRGAVSVFYAPRSEISIDWFLPGWARRWVCEELAKLL